MVRRLGVLCRQRRGLTAVLLVCLTLEVARALVGHAALVPAYSGPRYADSSQSTALLSQPRREIGATTVGDTVIFGGGQTDGSPSAAVDIFDSSTGAWTTASLSTGRARPELAVVGTVALVAGGIDTIGSQSAAVDIYDSATHSWSSSQLAHPWEIDPQTGRRPFRRPDIQVTGETALFIHDDIVDVFDASTHSWSRHPLAPVRTFVAVAKVGAIVLIAGGVTPEGASSDAVDLFDAASRTWSTATLSEARSSSSVAVVDERTVIFAGGSTNYVGSAAVDLYQADTRDWRAARVPGGVTSGGRVPAYSSSYSVAGAGGVAFFTSLNDMQILDLASGGWSEQRWDRPMVYPLGHVNDTLLFAARSYGNTTRAGVHAYDARTRRWSSAPSGQGPYLGDERSIAAQVKIGSKLILAGGREPARVGTKWSAQIDVYDTEHEAWTAGRLTQASEQLAWAVVGSTAVLVGGAAVDSYDSQTDTWASHTLAQARSEPPAVTAVGSYVLVASGSLERPVTGVSEVVRLPGVTDAVEILDTTSGTWSTATLQQARRAAVAATVGSRALFVGGFDVRAGELSDVVDTFSADSGAWSASRPRPNQRFLGDGIVPLGDGHAAALAFPEGIVVLDRQRDAWRTVTLTQPRGSVGFGTVGTIAIVAGGEEVASGQVTDAVDLFDAATGHQWTARLSEARSSPFMATIGSRVLIAGGRIAAARRPGDQARDSDRVDIFDAASGSWSTATLSIPRNAAGTRAVVVGQTAIFSGSSTPSGQPEPSVDLYDGETDAWTTRRIPDPRARDPIVVGQTVVFVAKGTDEYGSAAVYDTRTGAWRTHARAGIWSGKRLVVADRWLVRWGTNSTGKQTVVTVYDSEADRWSSLSPRSGAHEPAVTSIGSTVLFGGGLVPASDPEVPGVTRATDAVDLVDLSTGAWSQARPSQPRERLSAASVGHTAIFAGGIVREYTGRLRGDREADRTSATVDILTMESR